MAEDAGGAGSGGVGGWVGRLWKIDVRPFTMNERYWIRVARGVDRRLIAY